MKLLFDHNLSPRLVERLADVFPGAAHVAFEGLDRASDKTVWEHARRNAYLIVTKDADFNDLSVLYGSPPKVMWIRSGNCTTSQVESLLRTRSDAVHAFVADTRASILELF